MWAHVWAGTTRYCNHWVSNKALKEYITHKVTETLNPASVPCPHRLAEPGEKCAVHGQRIAAGSKLCCIPEQQVRSFVSQELLLRCETLHQSTASAAQLFLHAFAMATKDKPAAYFLPCTCPASNINTETQSCSEIIFPLQEC